MTNDVAEYDDTNHIDPDLTLEEVRQQARNLGLDVSGMSYDEMVYAIEQTLDCMDAVGAW